MKKNVDVSEIRQCLPEYLMQKNLPLKKPFRCLSPSHEDKNPSMSYNQRAQNVHCFACGMSYDLLDLIGLDYGIDSFSERYEKACAIFGVKPAVIQKKAAVAASAGYHPVAKSAVAVAPVLPAEPSIPAQPDRSGELDKLKKAAVAPVYLHSRGITDASIARFGLFETAERAYFPIMEREICTGWLGRSVDGREPRYRNSSGAMGIFGSDYITGGGIAGRIFITEGAIDAICLEQLGRRAVALCGSQNAGKLRALVQANLAHCRGLSFVSCGDGDEAGERMNSVLAAELGGLGLTVGTLGLAAGVDVAGLYHADRGELERALLALDRAAEDERSRYSAQSATGYISQFFIERERRRLHQVATGFPELDRILDGGLYPGLYVLGAISSLGKTSFILQMADNMAQEQDVLFFSLEQSRHELVSKSLSRVTAELDRQGKGLTTRQVISGHGMNSAYEERLLQDAALAYADTARGLFIEEGWGDVGVEQVRQAVAHHREMRGTAPVVVVDYLQILAPADSRATDKQNTDRAVVALRRISRDFSVPVIAVSSFNRENYRNKVSMESFKESGAVEYSADVLLAMQLRGAGEPGFDVNDAKAKEPRAVELVVLKNRSGVPYAKVGFEYEARWSRFR